MWILVPTFLLHKVSFVWGLGFLARGWEELINIYLCIYTGFYLFLRKVSFYMQRLHFEQVEFPFKYFSRKKMRHTDLRYLISLQ